MSTGKYDCLTKKIEDIALAYTTKNSNADNLESFMQDYLENLDEIQKIIKENKKPWLI